MNQANKKILIVDDSELNRSLLSDMLCDTFDILEAENGMQAIEILHEHELEISLMLLDIVMPEMDGFEVLGMMNEKGWIKTIPVIMISAETGGAYIDRAYDLGAIDYISRPFDERTVKHRVTSNYLLTVKQKEMAELLSDQMYQKEKDNSLMIEILSHIVEFRNGESGLHVLHVHVITELLLRRLVEKSKAYSLTEQEIHMIGNASALHDIGKISVPAEVLNKPGRLTPEEFEIMKRHTVEGAKMLQNIPFRRNDALVRVAHDICRYHHERYDGGGYPDGLKGDDIPIAAQVVAIADVYDALTSERVYKPPFSHEAALRMIANGECGAFNPVLLECLQDISQKLESELHVASFGHATDDSIRNTVQRMLKTGGTDASARSVRLLEQERMKFKFLSDLSRDIVFEYNAVPEMIKLSEQSTDSLGLPEKIVEPSADRLWTKLFGKDNFADFVGKLRATSPENAVATGKYLLQINRDKVWCKVTAKALWSEGETPVFEGAIGKIVDIDAEATAVAFWAQKAEEDERTGLLNHTAAKTRISALLQNAGDKQYALAVFDLDNFKKANDSYGHLFGDEVLEEVARRVKRNIRSTDLAARMGGDEFILFMEYKKSVTPQLKRIFDRLCEPFKEFAVSISMGVACTENFGGSYEELFRRADAAMYEVKRNKKNGFAFYADGTCASSRS